MNGHGEKADAHHLLAVVENVPFSDDTRLRKQVASLLDHGYRVSVVTRRDARNEGFRAVPRLRLLEYPAPPEGNGVWAYAAEYVVSLLWATRLTVRTCLRDRVDVVQFCQPPDVYFGLSWLVRALGCAVVIDQRDLMPELFGARFGRIPPFMSRVFHRLGRWNYRAADAVLCVNGYLERYVRACGARLSKVTVVRNGPVVSRLERAAVTPGLRPAARLCCWVGKMGRQDRLDLLLEVADRLVHALGRTDTHLAILGDGECLDEARALARKLGLEPWITFTGWVQEDVVFRYLVSADLGLDSSLQAEVSPVKAMEYMGAGLPFVAFDLPETRALSDGAAALVPPGDLDTLAATVSALLDDPQRRGAMGAAGRERVSSELAWEHQAVAYLSTIDRAVAGARRGSRTSDRTRV